MHLRIFPGMFPLVALVLGTAGCGGATPNGQSPAAVPSPAPEPQAQPAEQNLDELIPGAAVVSEQLLVGGQPSLVQIASLSNAGYRTVISLRAPGEPGSEGEQEAVEAAGMRFVSIPVSGASDLTVINAARISSELGGDHGPFVLHCGSGNRSGAMIALIELIEHDATPSEALERGRRAGLSGLEAETAAILNDLCQDLPEGNCE